MTGAGQSEAVPRQGVRASPRAQKSPAGASLPEYPWPQAGAEFAEC